MPEVDRQILNNIQASLDQVGKTKAVGYLPIYTITKVLNDTINARIGPLVKRGLKVRVFGEEETCIKSGALFVYNHDMVLTIIEKYKVEIASRNWNPSPEFIIERIACEWFESTTPIMEFIRDLYNDH